MENVSFWAGSVRKAVGGMLLGAVLPAHLVGCAAPMTSSVQVRAEPPKQRIRLQRPDLPPLTGAWRQEGDVVIGQLAFTTSCQSETVTVLRRTETHKPSSSAAVGPTLAIIGGAALSVLGVGLMATAPSKNHDVICGSGSSAPKAGDTCDSEASVYTDLGIAVLGLGLGTGALGIMSMPDKSKERSVDLPSQESVKIAPDPRPCGDIAALKGAQVTATIPGGARWSGQVDANGEVRIDLSQGPTPRDGTAATFAIESLPVDAPTVVEQGTPLGALVLHTASAPTAPRRGVFLRAAN